MQFRLLALDRYFERNTLEVATNIPRLPTSHFSRIRFLSKDVKQRCKNRTWLFWTMRDPSSPCGFAPESW